MTPQYTARLPVATVQPAKRYFHLTRGPGYLQSMCCHPIFPQLEL